MQIIQVKTKRQLREFIYVPAKIHSGHANWVPPIYSDEWDFYNPKKNRAMSYSDTILFLARKDGRTVGRIMGIINNRYNEIHNEKTARFFNLETYKDLDVAKALLRKVEEWAHSKGMERLIGPMGFSDKDPQGLLIEGYDQPIVLASNCNYPYLVDFVTQSGFEKDIDLVVYKVPIPDELPDFYLRILERVKRRANSFKMLNFSKRSELKPFIKPVLSLVNETFVDIYGFNPMDPEEMEELAAKYLTFIDPRFIKIIVNSDNKPLAFILGVPDICPGIQKSKGHLFPFGFIHILKAMKSAKMLSLLLGAIHPQYRNLGFDTWMGAEMLNEARKAGMTTIDSHLELETNKKMRAEMEKMGGVVYKRYRIFQKKLV
ncbi:GNAT family N-acetyltransferase [Tenuifilum thalassicum]|uniref:GNAT family N-acetyltransferase n=1 Tax=Tenuifilum thalassicum TaxID=2590900 RepID=A0A7D3Y5C0_9BACT|nr:GNAT family N-acetyltransferase [Tenuifilum thalassicum]QKG80509.1 GNAT family N-acetyltransferase [Tenuifilum thalassicum]